MVTSLFHNPARYPEEGPQNLQHTLNRALRQAYAELPAAAALYARVDMNVWGEPGRSQDSPAQTLAKLNGMLPALATARGVPPPTGLPALLGAAGSGMTPALAARLNYFLLSLPYTPEQGAVPAQRTPAPVVTAQPAVLPAGGPAGTVFTGVPGAYTDGALVALRWLLDGQLVATGSTYQSLYPGSLQFQVTVAGPGGQLVAASAPVAVGVVTRTATVLLPLEGLLLDSVGPKRGQLVAPLALGVPQLRGTSVVEQRAGAAQLVLADAITYATAALLVSGTTGQFTLSLSGAAAAKLKLGGAASLSLAPATLLSSNFVGTTGYAQLNLTARVTTSATGSSGLSSTGTLSLQGAAVSATAALGVAAGGTTTLQSATVAAAATVGNAARLAAAQLQLQPAQVTAAATLNGGQTDATFGSRRQVWGSDQQEFG